MIFVNKVHRERVSAGLMAAFLVLLFGGIGLACLYGIVGTLANGLRASGWVEVPARLEHWNDGDARYTYEYQGRTHRGTRVGAFAYEGSSEVDDWDARMEAKFAAAKAEGRPIVAFVNPSDPAQSLLDREYRWKVLLVFVPLTLGFGGIGIFFGWLLGRKALGLHGLGLPYMQPRTRHTIVAWIVAIAWNSVAIPIAVLAIPELYRKGEWFPVALLAIFPLVGLFIAWSALTGTWKVVYQGTALGPNLRHDRRYL